jgi:hypothetical protein
MKRKVTLTEKECDVIMAPLLEASLTKSHIHQNFPRDVVYGPASEKGLGYNNIYTRQGMMQISKLNQHINDNDSITGKFIRNTIEIATIEMGIGRNIFALEYSRYANLLTDCWIKHI